MRTALCHLAGILVLSGALVSAQPACAQAPAGTNDSGNQARKLSLAIRMALSPMSLYLARKGLQDNPMVDTIAGLSRDDRLAMALAAVKQTGSPHAIGTGSVIGDAPQDRNQYEYGAVIRPNGTALVVARMRMPEGTYATVIAADIDAMGIITMRPDPAPADLKELSVVRPGQKLPRDPVPIKDLVADPRAASAPSPAPNANAPVQRPTSTSDGAQASQREAMRRHDEMFEQQRQAEAERMRMSQAYEDQRQREVQAQEELRRMQESQRRAMEVQMEIERQRQQNRW